MYSFVRILFDVRYMKVVYLTTNMIQIKLYTIRSSHQLGLEVERAEQNTAFSFSCYIKEIFLVFCDFFRLHI